MSSLPQYTGVNWALTGVSAALTVGRFAIRRFHLHQLFWDDLVHSVALLVLIAHGVTNQITSDAKVRLALAVATKGESQIELLKLYYHVRYLNTINNCFLYLVFWVVKVSVLLFYWSLFNTSRSFKKAWWAVMTFTLLTFWVPIAGVLATCNKVNTVPEFKACNSATRTRATKLEYSCVINVVSDLAVLALPLWMLKDLKVQTYQKIGLTFIFSLAVVCIVLDIVRTIEALASNQALYTVLEINFAVIISCLPTYRALLNMGQRRQSGKPSWGSRPSVLSSWRRGPKNSSWKSVGSGPPPRSDHGHIQTPASDLESGTEPGPGRIHVTKAFTVSEGTRDLYDLEPLDLPDLQVQSPRPARV